MELLGTIDFFSHLWESAPPNSAKIRGVLFAIDRRVGYAESEHPMLLSRGIIFEVFQPYGILTLQTDERTDSVTVITDVCTKTFDLGSWRKCCHSVRHFSNEAATKLGLCPVTRVTPNWSWVIVYYSSARIKYWKMTGIIKFHENQTFSRNHMCNERMKEPN